LTRAVVGVVCALRSEARHLGRTLSRDASVESLAADKLLAVTGMGCAAAAAGAEALVTAGATALISWGLAGGLDPQLRAGQIFLPSEIAACDGTVLTSDSAWREGLCASLIGHPALSSGRLATSAAAVGSVAAKTALYRSTGARAVDMESAAIAAVAERRGLPFIAVRVIVDRAADEVPAVVLAATDGSGRVAVLPLLGRLLRRPAQIPALLRLAHGYLEANRSLAAVARSGALGRATGSPSRAGVA
jgi:adenosylhomocysteine nucleosidase